MKLTFYGHACFVLETAGKRILFDPFIRGNSLAEEAGVDIDSIEADYILISHGHDDHTGDMMYLANKTGATVVANWEIYSWMNKQGYSNGHPMNIGGEWTFDFGKIKMTAATHSSSFADGTYAGLAAGYLIESEGKTVYFSGDTALTQDMALLGELFQIDYAILPIGNNFTMGYKDANLAADKVKCNNVIAMHYDTFGYIKVNHQEVSDYFTSKGKSITFIPINTSIEI